MAALTDALKSADGLVRANAVEALGKIGDDAEAAVPAIAGLLKDPVTDVRQAAAAALVRGPNPIHAAPALSAALKDPDADVRLMATQALTRLRNAAEIAVPDLVLALRDTNKDVRAAAVVTLAVAGCGGEGTVSAITSLLKDARTSVRQAAALALRGCVITDAEISDLIDALKGPDAEVRALSIEALSRSPAYSDAAVSALADALTDPNEEVRLAAASAFRYRAMPTAAAPAIAAMLRAPDKRERLAAANAAIYFAQPGNNEFVSALINALKDNDKKVRVAAAQALRGSYTPRYQYEGGTMYSRPIYSQPIYSDPVYLPPPPSPPAYYTPHLDKEPDPEVEAKVLALLEALEDPDKEVREASIRSLTSFGPTAKIAVPSLSKKLSDTRVDVKQGAATVLAEIGKDAEPAIPALIETLNDVEKAVRLHAAVAIVRIQITGWPDGAMRVLIQGLEDTDPLVVAEASWAFDFMGSHAQRAVPELLPALRDPKERTRQAVMSALGDIGPEAKAAVPQLIATLNETSIGQRRSALSALDRIGPGAKAAVPAVSAFISDPDEGVRTLALRAIGSVGSGAGAPIDALQKALHDPSLAVRYTAIQALANMGTEALPAVPGLIEALKDPDAQTRTYAANSLQTLARTAADKQATGASDVFVLAARAMRDSEDLYVNKAADNVAQSIALLKPSPTIWQHIQNWASSNPTWALVLGLYALWSFTWILLFWFRPLTVLRCNEALIPIDYKLPAWLGGGTLPLRYLLIIGFFGYHPHLLDTWVESVLSTVRERFKLKETVRDRSVHVALPVVLNGTNVPNLSATDLKATFARRIACLLICGEGGSGKTSLACQIAQWSIAEDRGQRLTSHVMLPVIIEQELDFTVSKDSDILIESIRRQLQDLTDTSEPVTAPHLQALLRRQRILVIIDHLSEMSPETRAKIQPQAANFPINALIVTSRLKESLGEVAKTVVEPLRVEGNRLSSFMEAYLRQRNARDLFDDTEFFEICRSLSVIVGQRNITVLLAKIYAEQQISRKQGISQDKLPENIPDLMLTYVNHLNRTVVTGRLEEDVLQRDAKIIAWKCLQRSYTPEPANYNEVITVLGGDNAKQRLEYFENRLNLIRRVEPAAVRFALDPLAEYLSGLYVVADCGRQANAWRQFISHADELPSRAGIAGFMLAVRDCCSAERERRMKSGSSTGPIPDFVEDELARRAVVGL